MFSGYWWSSLLYPLAKPCLKQSKDKKINPLVTNALSRPYQLDESTYIFIGGIRSKCLFLFHFSMKFLQANRIAPDGTPRFVASYLGIFCLPMSYKKGARIIWVTPNFNQLNQSEDENQPKFFHDNIKGETTVD